MVLIFLDSLMALANSAKSEFFLDPPNITTNGSEKELIAAMAVSGVVENESL